MDKWEKVKKLRSLEVLGEAPREASSNLQAPETAPFDKRITGRTKPLSLKATPEFHQELKKMATKKECLMIEILEKALEFYKKNLLPTKNGSFTEYEKQSKKEKLPLSNDREQKTLPKSQKKAVQRSTQEEFKQFWKVDFICNICQRKFERSIAYSPAPNLDQLNRYPTYCADCKAEIEAARKVCSFREVDDKTKKYMLCDKPTFDKKKQLCRSHNYQVRKRFNEFTKDMSIGSTAAWEMAWEQSGSWRYFWNLGKEKSNE